MAREKVQMEPSSLAEWTRQSMQFRKVKLARIFRVKVPEKRNKCEGKSDRDKDRDRERERS